MVDKILNNDMKHNQTRGSFPMDIYFPSHVAQGGKHRCQMFPIDKANYEHSTKFLEIGIISYTNILEQWLNVLSTTPPGSLKRFPSCISPYSPLQMDLLHELKDRIASMRRRQHKVCLAPNTSPAPQKR